MEVGNKVLGSIVPYGKYAIEIYWNKLLYWSDSGGISIE